MIESFCGVGNPFSLGPVNQGDSVLDFGCGAGFDLFIAANLAGRTGGLFGIDLTPDMTEQARKNLIDAGVGRFEVRTIDSEKLPYADMSFDIIISNGVVNLCIGKETCFSEMYRVLKRGGRLQIADVMLEQELPASLVGSAEAWSQ